MASLARLSLIFGDDGDNTLTGGAAAEVLHGQGGDDTLIGGAGDDTLIGGLGADMLIGGPGADVLYGEEGDDTAVYTHDDEDGGLNRYFAGDGSDTLVLEFSQEDYLATGAIFDVRAYADLLDQGITPGDGGEYLFDSFSLSVSSFENLVIRVDGVEVDPDDVPGLDAVDDAFSGADNTQLAGDVTLNDGIVPTTTVALVTGPATGSLTLLGDGTFTYDPPEAFRALSVGETETVSFTYRLDTIYGVDSATATITINGANENPTAADIDAAITENQSFSGDLLADSGAADIDRLDSLTIASVEGTPVGASTTITLGSGAQITVSDDGTFTYDPGTAFDFLAQDAPGSDSVTFVVEDDQGGAVTATLNIAITGQNDAPTAAPDTLSVTERNNPALPDGFALFADNGHYYRFVAGDFTYDEASADAAAMGAHLATITSDAENAFLAGLYTGPSWIGGSDAAEEGVWIWTEGPEAGQVFWTGGPDGSTETYASWNGGEPNDAGNEDYANFLAGGVWNDIPSPFTGTLDIGYIAEISDPSGFSLPLTGSVAGNDGDVDDGAVLTYTLDEALAGLTLFADGSYEFDAADPAYDGLAEGEVVTLTAEYTVTDQFEASAGSTLTITLTGVNDAPVVDPFALTISEDDPSAMIDLLQTASDVDGDPLSVAGVVQTSGRDVLGALDFAAYKFVGLAAETFAGIPIAVGDVTGDGVLDYAVKMDDAAGGGRTLLLSGAPGVLASLDAADGSVDGQIQMDAGAQALGITVNGGVRSRIGDINDDGIDDLAFSDPNAGTGGEVYVAFGGASLLGLGAEIDRSELDGTNGFVIGGADAGDGFSLPLTQTIGDVTGDGVGDFIAAARLADADGLRDAGEGYVISGADLAGAADETGFIDVDDLLTMTSYRLDGDFTIANVAGGQLGNNAGGGDIDGDGVADLLFGAPRAGGVNNAFETGEAYILFGGAASLEAADGADASDDNQINVGSLDGTTGYQLLGGDPLDAAGIAVTVIGDVDDDGFNDFIVGADERASPTLAGEAYLVFGGRDNLAAFDADDGVVDGRIVLENVAGGFGYRIEGENAAELFGNNVSPAGDLDGDGADDFVIGNIGRDVFNQLGTGVDPVGKARIFYGGQLAVLDAADGSSDGVLFAANLDETTGLVLSEEAQADTFGAPRIEVADFDGDGLLDVFVAAVTADSPGGAVDAGAGYLFRGGAGVLSQLDALDGAVDGRVDAGLALGALTDLSQGAGGSFVVSGDMADFDPSVFTDLPAGASETLTFDVSVTDGLATTTATLTVTVTGVNDAPVANDDSATTDEDTPVEIDLLANDTDVDQGASLTATIPGATGAFGFADAVLDFVLTNPGSTNDPNAALGAPDDVFVSLPTGSAITVAFLDEIVFDGEGDDLFIGEFGPGGEFATIEVSSDGENFFEIGTAANNTVTAFDLADIDFTGQLFAVRVTGLDNGGSFPGYDLDFVQAIGVSVDSIRGTLTDLGGGVVSFDPRGAFDDLAAGDTATTTFNYVLTDDQGAIDTASVTVTVTGVNDAPVAADDSASTDEDSAADIFVLGNDSDVDDGFTITAVGATSPGGAVSIGGSGTFVTFDPNGDFEGLADGQSTTVSFTYTITDDFGDSDTATVTVTVTGVNDAPVAADDSASTDEDSAADIFVLDNDSDVDDGFTITAVGATSPGGAVSIGGSGTFVTFDPNGDFETLGVGQSATVSFTYTITDDFGDTDTATVTVTVTGVNDDPTANDISTSTDEDNPVGGDLVVDGAVADVDATDTSFTVTQIDGADFTGSATFSVSGGGIVTVDDTGAFTFDPNGDFETLAPTQSATVSFTYTVSDGNGGAATATAAIRVDGVNDAPVTTPVERSFGQNDASATIDLLSTATDVDGGSLTVTFLEQTGGRDVFAQGGAFAAYRGQGDLFLSTYSMGSSFVIGDVNNDGFDDLGVELIGGSFGKIILDDAVTVIFGGADALPGYDLFDGAADGVYSLFGAQQAGVQIFGPGGAGGGQLFGSGGSGFGSVQTSIDDLNGDGIDELLIGAPFSQYGGEAYILFGGAANFTAGALVDTQGESFTTENGLVLTGLPFLGEGSATTQFGGAASYERVADIDGDGIDELLIGAPAGEGASGGYYSYAGEAYLIFSGALTEASGLFVGVPALVGGGAVLFGGAEPYASAGSSVTAGDISGDGMTDIVIGAPFGGGYDSVSGSYAGAVHVVLGDQIDLLDGADGATNGAADLGRLDGTYGFTLLGVNSNEQAGADVAVIGDVNGDGIDDLLIGAPSNQYFKNGSANGAYLVFGGLASLQAFDAADGADGVIDLGGLASGGFGYRIEGVVADEGAGATVTAAGDVDGDGRGDFLIGSFGGLPGEPPEQGRSWLVFGGQLEALDTASGSDDNVLLLADLDGVTGFQFGEEAANSDFGVDASVGDINGDGVTDLLISAPTYSGAYGPYAVSGAHYLIFGASGQLAALDAADGSSDGVIDAGLAVGARSQAAGFALDPTLPVIGFDPSFFADLGADETDVLTFSFVVSDGLAEVTETLSITVTGVNDAPTASDFSRSIDEDSGFSANLFTDALASDVDFGDTLSIDFQAGVVFGEGGVATLPSGASVTLNFATGDFTYDASGAFDFLAEGATGGDSFSYFVRDEGGLGAEVTVTVTISGVNDAPQTSPVDRTFSQNDASTTIDLLSTTTDPDTATLTVTSFSQTGGRDVFSGDNFAGYRINHDLSSVAQIFDGSSAFAVGDVNDDGFQDFVMRFEGQTFGNFDPQGAALFVYGGPDALPSLDLDDLVENGVISASNIGPGEGFLILGPGDGGFASGSNVGADLPGGFAAEPVTVTGDGAFDFTPVQIIIGGEGPSVQLPPDYDAGFAQIVARAGDINGDGIDDIAVSAPYAYYGYGEVYIVFGGDTNFAQADGVLDTGLAGDFTAANGYVLFGLSGGEGGESFGAGVSMEPVGDVIDGDGVIRTEIAGDGLDDLLIGAPYGSGSGIYGGSAVLVSGEALAAQAGFEINVSTLVGAGALRFDGESAYAYAGKDVAAGDIDGDGVTDLIIGAPYTGAQTYEGAAYVVFASGFAALDAANGEGGTDGVSDLGDVDGVTGFALRGSADGEYAGRTVGVINDLNGDGFAEILVGAPGTYFSQIGGGSLSYIVFGGEANLAALDAADGVSDGNVDLGLVASTGRGYEVRGESAYDGAGSTLFGDDIDGDGVDDLVVGGFPIFSASFGPFQQGTSWFVYGDQLETLDAADASNDNVLNLGAVDGVSGYRITGEQEYSHFGATAGVDDINGDGLADLVISAGGNYDFQTISGGTYVIFNAPGQFAALDALDGEADGTIDIELVVGALSTGVGPALDPTLPVIGFDPSFFDDLGQGEFEDLTFEFTVSDGIAGDVTETLTIRVNGVNDTPTAQGFFRQTDEDTSFSGNLFDDSFAADPDVTDTLSLEFSGLVFGEGGIVTLPSGAQLTVDFSTGDYTYDPSGAFDFLAADSGAPDSFTFSVVDDFGASATVTASIGVNGVNDAPIGQADVFAVQSPNTFDGSLTATDPEGDSFTFAIISGPSLGGVESDPSGVFSYFPPFTGANTTDSMDVRVTDSNGASSVFTVTFNIAGAPIAGGGVVPMGALAFNVAPPAAPDPVIGTKASEELVGTNDADIIFGGAGDDTLSGLAGGDELYGEAGDDLLLGDKGADTLSGGAGNDTLDGGGAGDLFLYSADFGNDLIVGFEDGLDRFDFTAHATVGGFGDLSLTQIGADVQIDDGAGGLILVQGTALSALDTGDFVF